MRQIENLYQVEYSAFLRLKFVYNLISFHVRQPSFHIAADHPAIVAQFAGITWHQSYNCQKSQRN